MKKWIQIFAIVLFANNLNAQNTIVTDTILQLSTCAGGNVIVPFSTTGTFPLGNVFTAELSNAFGQFTAPVAIGSAPFNIGFILATIPANTNFGFLYKVRVVSTNPAIIGSPCPNTLVVSQVAQLNQIIATPNDTACIGDVITLTSLNPADSYLWSTGDTSASINVTQSGNYSVQTVDFLGCETDTSKTVFFESCPVGLDEIDLESMFLIYPNPTSGAATITSNYDLQSGYQLRVLNHLGQTIHEKQHVVEFPFQLKIESSGIYFLEIIQGELVARKKLIVN